MGLVAPAPTPNTLNAGTPRMAAITAVTTTASTRLIQKLEIPTREDENPGGIAAYAEEGGVAEAGDARVSPDDVKAHPEEGVDHHLRDEAGDE